MYLDRRELLKIGGASAAGLALSGLDLPYLPFKPALADAVSENAWCFGVMADTQWKDSDDDDEAASTCALRIVHALNEQFINHGCKFVIQVGDLVNDEAKDGHRNLPYRADACQALYDKGIGFFPVRGNHESSATAAGEMRTLFPQMSGGENSVGATNFTYPFDLLKGLSYSFDYDNVRCVFIDQFVRPDGTNYNGESSYNNNLLDQIDWVETTLEEKGADQHAFVFAHKNLIGQNHKDVLTGANLTANSTERDRFIKILDTNGVGYYLGGHDHVHHRSMVTDAAKTYNVDQIICSSNSYKFYTPKSGDDGREYPVCQELYTIGFYIFTVDGSRVTVDFYSASTGADYGDSDRITTLPETLTFYLRERFGCSLNGGNFAVQRSGAYTDVTSTYSGYTAKILSGTNKNSETDILGRELWKTVNTGWAESSSVVNAASPIFSLWGLVDNLSLYDKSLTGELPASDEPTATDTYTLSISYNTKKFRPSQLVTGRVAIAACGEDQLWKNATAFNTGGSKKFVLGPWKDTYGLGTYGIDTKSGTVWAVLNHESDFVVKYI
nr:metallophosphoesterase [uncultured Desulfobulbus sp.]